MGQKNIILYYKQQGGKWSKMNELRRVMPQNPGSSPSTQMVLKHELLNCSHPLAPSGSRLEAAFLCPFLTPL